MPCRGMPDDADLESRVETLERGQRGLSASIGRLDADVAEIKSRLAGLATRADTDEIKLLLGAGIARVIRTLRPTLVVVALVAVLLLVEMARHGRW